MYLSHLSLNQFRNYPQLDLTLGPGLFVFYGDNAQGKTNLLEAVGMLATATSFHASSDREVVNWYAPEHVARISGKARRQSDDVHVEMVIFDPTPPVLPGTPQDTQTIELPAHASRKRFKVNGVPKRTVDVIGQMKVVLFAPSDLHLVDGAPEERRRFLDRALCQVRPRYCQALIKYRKIVTQRSALLKRIRDNQEDPGLLDYLDEQLTTLANMVVYERQHMVGVLNEQAQHVQSLVSGGREHLQITYRPSFKTDERWDAYEAPHHYMEQLRSVRHKELHQGVCLLGPHRDDLEFQINGVNMLSYGSRGQQRTAALAAKLAELAYMRTCTGDEPILLLDDVFSELDHHRRTYLLDEIRQHTQILLTANDLAGLPADIMEQAHIYHVVEGTLQHETPSSQA